MKESVCRVAVYKIGHHHSDAGQYCHIVGDIRSFLLDKNITYEDMLNYEKQILERIKVVEDYQMDLCF